MPVKWDDELEKKFYLAIIHDLGAPTPNFANVATLMGPEYTAESLRTRWFKTTRKQAAAQFGDTKGGTPVKKTPSKNGGSIKSGSKRKAKEDLDNDEEQTPSKKTKATGKEEQAEESEGEMV